MLKCLKPPRLHNRRNEGPALFPFVEVKDSVRRRNLDTAARLFRKLRPDYCFINLRRSRIPILPGKYSYLQTWVQASFRQLKRGPQCETSSDIVACFTFATLISRVKSTIWTHLTGLQCFGHPLSKGILGSYLVSTIHANVV